MTKPNCGMPTLAEVDEWDRETFGYPPWTSERRLINAVRELARELADAKQEAGEYRGELERLRREREGIAVGETTSIAPPGSAWCECCGQMIADPEPEEP